MASHERIRGVQVYRPIIYGSHARWLTAKEKETAPENHTHKWTVFLTSATSPPPAPSSSTDAPPEIDMDGLPGGADDLSYLMKKVTFKLHDTYTNPNRVLDKPPFRVTETGWGEFVVNIRIQFIPESGEKPMSLAHPIRLFHWGPPIEAPPVPAPTVPTSPEASAEAGPSNPAAPTPAPLPAAAGAADRGSGDDTDVKMEAATPAAAPTPVPAAAGDIVDGHAAASGSAAAAAAASTDTASEHLEPTVIVAQAPVPVSIASKYPVHSWQYDELVFSDPPAAFLEILNKSPPTRLPARNRRARDQREEHEVRSGGSGNKSKKGRVSAVAGSSASIAARSRGGTAVAGDTKESGLAALQVGIPGEPGSADVPMEFSQEMEKGEYNRLAEARVRIIEEMDKWRERLISQEKELARIKEEMKGQARIVG